MFLKLKGAMMMPQRALRHYHHCLTILSPLGQSSLCLPDSKHQDLLLHCQRALVVPMPGWSLLQCPAFNPPLQLHANSSGVFPPVPPEQDDAERDCVGPVLYLFFKQSALHRATFSLAYMVSAARKKTEVLASLLHFIFVQPCTASCFQFQNSFCRVLCSSPMHLELAVKCGLFSMFSIKSYVWEVIYQQDYRLEYCENWTPRCHNSLENASHGRFYLPAAVHY